MLYIVATPIGNMSEMTFRAVEVLKNCDIIAAEDTRHSGILLKYYGIDTPMLSYHKFNEKKALDALVEKLKEGKNVALVSDAGMPLISDPGNILTRELSERGLPFTVVSGACACVSALVLSGLPSAAFCFVGFLPEKIIDRKRLLESYKNLPCTLVFYSAVHDVEADLDFLFRELGPRGVAVVREISKVFEEVVRCRLGDVPPLTLKGEFVVVVEGAPERVYDMSLSEHVGLLMDEGLDKKAAIKKVAAERKIAKSLVYKEVTGGEED